MANDNKGYISEVRVARNTQKYSDINLDFIPHPSSGDIVSLSDKAAVIRSIRNIMFTDNNERLFNPNFGGNIKGLLFEPINPATTHKIRLWIINAIEKFEPRASIHKVDVKVSPDEHQYNITIVFSIDSISELVDYAFALERLR